MSVLLADHNIEGQARLLFGALTALGWVELLDLKLVTFADVGLSDDSSDRAVWRQAQHFDMLLLTNNRDKEGPDSLEQTLRDELTSASLPDLHPLSRPDRRGASRDADLCRDPMR